VPASALLLPCCLFFPSIPHASFCRPAFRMAPKCEPLCHFSDRYPLALPARPLLTPSQALLHHLSPPSPQARAPQPPRRGSGKSAPHSLMSKGRPLRFSRRQHHLLLLHHRRPAPLSLFLPGLGSSKHRHGLQGMYLHPRAARGMASVATLSPRVPHVCDPRIRI
jgi:hypothetical protein